MIRVWGRVGVTLSLMVVVTVRVSEELGSGSV